MGDLPENGLIEDNVGNRDLVELRDREFALLAVDVSVAAVLLPSHHLHHLLLPVFPAVFLGLPSSSVL